MSTTCRVNFGDVILPRDLPFILARHALCGPIDTASMAPRERRPNFIVATDMSEGLLLQMQQHKRRSLLQLQIAPVEDPSHPIEFTQEKALACGLLLTSDTKAASPQARSA